MKMSAFAFLLLGPVAFGGTLWAADEPRPCNLATLKGDWGIGITGFRPSSPNGPLEQAVGTLIRHYDGAGGFTQVDNVHGAVSGHTPDRPGKGTYIVNADCSAVAKADIPGVAIQPEERFVIVDDGNGSFSATSAPAPLLITNQGRRINSIDSPAKAAQAELLAQLMRLLNSIAVRLGVAPYMPN
jgi:hypothetical protein